LGLNFNAAAAGTGDGWDAQNVAACRHLGNTPRGVKVIFDLFRGVVYVENQPEGTFLQAVEKHRC
jgi:hypothetical protein